MRKARRLVILCNALDDSIRLARGISTDSPAASRKVFLAARAVSTAQVQPLIVSMGRGRADKSPRTFPTTVRRHAGTSVVYLRFTHRRLLSPVVSMLAPVGILWRLRRCAKTSTILFYNQLPAYLPALLTARLLGFGRVLDLEDGATNDGTRLHRALDRMLREPFELLCQRALLACGRLAQYTRLRPTVSYYGAIEEIGKQRDWQTAQLNVLLGGTIAPETGAPLLVAAITELRRMSPSWAAKLSFEITGKGSSMPEFESLALSEAVPRVAVHGRTSDAEYRDIVDRTHVGLALKPNLGVLADTTFPSKVTELAGSGMLVLTTDISDVRAVLGDGARYLTSDDPAMLIDQLREIVADRSAAAATAERGAANVTNICSPTRAGRLLADFLFADAAP